MELSVSGSVTPVSDWATKVSFFSEISSNQGSMTGGYSRVWVIVYKKPLTLGLWREGSESIEMWSVSVQLAAVMTRSYHSIQNSFIVQRGEIACIMPDNSLYWSLLNLFKQETFKILLWLSVCLSVWLSDCLTDPEQSWNLICLLVWSVCNYSTELSDSVSDWSDKNTQRKL